MSRISSDSSASSLAPALTPLIAPTTWAQYLATGIPNPPPTVQTLPKVQKMFFSSQIMTEGGEFAQHLCAHGWAVIEAVDGDFDTAANVGLPHVSDIGDGLIDLINRRTHTFHQAFSLDQEVKDASGLYRTENGVSIGYRNDREREFFETRLTDQYKVEPSFSSTCTTYTQEYERVVLAIYQLLHHLAKKVLQAVADHLGLDARVFVDLTDIEEKGCEYTGNYSSSGSSSSSGSKSNEENKRDPLGSSLLRICKYSPMTDEDPKLAFGAHTDSCFVTLGLVSNTPGLEIVDQVSKKWVSVEKPQVLKKLERNEDHDVTWSKSVAAAAAVTRSRSNGSSNSSSRNNSTTTINTSPLQQPVQIIVFVGEFLQVLSKNRFSAAVHRVRSNLSGLTRISCPLLIRGRHTAVINITDSKYDHPGGQTAVTEDKIPDLDGIPMKTLHKLLDLKRQKCFRDNNSEEGNWVLSAFPIDPPEEYADDEEMEKESILLTGGEAAVKAVAVAVTIENDID